MGASVFNSGISGLLANQTGLATTGHNISNVNTEGYSRQRVELGARPGQSRGNGFVGSGVDINTITRLVDGFTNSQIRTSTSAHSELDVLHRLASQVDNLLADPDGGLSPAIQSFFGGIQELAADPSSVPARDVVLGEAGGLVNRFHTLDRRLDDISRGVEQSIKDLTSEINALTSDIAGYNSRIIRAEGASGGHPANDLRDQRDELIRQLTERVGVATVPQDDGALNVFFTTGQALVVGQSSITLSVEAGTYDPSRGELSVSVAGTASPLSSRLTGGELAGVLDFRDRVLDPARRELGRTALGIAETVNDQHRLGYDLDGRAGGDFFNALETASPAIFAHSANTGAPSASISLEIMDVAALSESSYQLDRTGANYTLTRLSDNAVTNLTGFPAAEITVDGIAMSLASGTIADGDSFLIEPARFAAGDIALSVTGPRRIAAAAPVHASGSLSNTGDARISEASVNPHDNELTYTFTAANLFDVRDATTGATLATGVAYTPGANITFNGVTVDITGAPAAGDVFESVATVTSAQTGNAGTGVISPATVGSPDANLTDSVTITFTGPNTYDVTGATTGSPTVGLTYTPGAPLSFNGWTVSIDGGPLAGDTFTVAANSGGVGDNRNALALAALQTSGTLDQGSSTYEEAYGQLIANVGTTTRQAEINSSAQAALLVQAEEARAAVSGVNLDEEAANLIRYQQAYAASAQVIAVADEIFQTLIGAVQR